MSLIKECVGRDGPLAYHSCFWLIKQLLEWNIPVMASLKCLRSQSQKIILCLIIIIVLADNLKWETIKFVGEIFYNTN